MSIDYFFKSIKNIGFIGDFIFQCADKINFYYNLFPYFTDEYSSIYYESTYKVQYSILVKSLKKTIGYPINLSEDLHPSQKKNPL